MLTLPLTEQQAELIISLTRLQDKKTKRAAYLLLVENESTANTASQVTSELSEEELAAGERLTQQGAHNTRTRCIKTIELVNDLVKTIPVKSAKKAKK